MRVLVATNNYPPGRPGGYERICESAVRALREAGHEVRVLTTEAGGPGGPEPDPEVHRELRWYWRDYAFPSIGPRARLELERHNAAVFERHLAELRPDVVSWWAMGGMSLSLVERARRAGLPAVGVVGDAWMLYGPRVDAWLRLWRRLPARHFAEIPTRVDLGRAARWIFISETLRDDALAVRRLEDVDVSRPGVDPERFAPQPPRAWEWNLLSIGRIDARKGIATAIEALPLLPEEATLTIDGDGDPEHVGELRRLAERTEVAGRVRFICSPAEEVPGSYTRADAVLFTVVWKEPWGLVPLEAMATGRPVVATGLGGSGEYLRDGDNALLVPPADAQALAAALRRLAGDPGLRDRLRTGGLRTTAGLPARDFQQTVVAAHEAAARRGAGD